ncbi:hypothetical protein SCHPADRAFT_905150 [Schizopora paradoxa]|uniref:DUF6534 domain-containing protein n=1 Tax=Schizopora paradoxa TaxID=27342 RepID=A0A0H2S631_9AGAM|nr:hypothetical protein SCHPADRAFT_905150 [Schizopora paradoxa]
MSSPAALPALDNTMGALYVGVLLAMGLWGVSSLQMYYYFNRYSKDDYRLKLLVVLVWLLDTAHQALISHTAYSYLITNYANPVYLGHIVRSLVVMVQFSAFICLAVQLFLVQRVWALSHRNIPVTVILLLLVTGEFISTTLYFARAIQFELFSELPEIFNISRSINILGAASDVAIALTLIFLLQRSRTGFSRSETIITKLVIFTINTGLLTSGCAVMSLITITVFPNNFIYITFFVLISKLYTNTLFATLNARKSTRGGLPDDTENGLTSSTINNVSMSRMRPRAYDVEAVNTMKASQLASQRGGILSIKVDTETTNDVVRPTTGSRERKDSSSDSDSAYPYEAKLAL